jgi:hypothetical protein
MNFHVLNCAAAFVALAGAATVACNNPPPPPSDAYVQSFINPPSFRASCPAVASNTQVLAVGNGDPSSPNKPSTVQDQGSQSGANVGVSCTIHPDNNGFDVSLEVTLAGQNGGSITINTAPGTQVTSMGGTVSATFNAYNESFGTFQSDNCTLDYGNAHPSDNQPIAGGRVWGHILCPQVVEQTGKTGTSPEGGSEPETCAGEAYFLFEQCAQ